MKYEIFEHTADIGIKVFGTTYEEIFNNSVESFADIMVDTSQLVLNKTRKITMSSKSPDLLLVDLLSLILYDFEAENILYFKSDIKYSNSEVRISGTLNGGTVPEDVDYRNVIKAVTYHGLELYPEKGYAKIVFDI